MSDIITSGEGIKKPDRRLFLKSLTLGGAAFALGVMANKLSSHITKSNDTGLAQGSLMASLSTAFGEESLSYAENNHETIIYNKKGHPLLILEK